MKTKLVTSRMTEELFQMIDEYARERQWSLSQTVCYILSTFLTKENRVS